MAGPEVMRVSSRLGVIPRAQVDPSCVDIRNPTEVPSPSGASATTTARSTLVGSHGPLGAGSGGAGVTWLFTGWPLVGVVPPVPEVGPLPCWGVGWRVTAGDCPV